MGNGARETIAGVVLSEQETITLDELAGLCTVEKHWVMELVEEGALEPLAMSRREWQFPVTVLGRVHTAARLRRDLDLDVAGIALTLDLLDEIESLRARLRSFDDIS